MAPQLSLFCMADKHRELVPATHVVKFNEVHTVCYCGQCASYSVQRGAKTIIPIEACTRR